MAKKSSLIALGVVFLVSAILIYYVQIHLPSKISYGDVAVEQAKALIDWKPALVILDVRTEGEFNDGHIEGAINIPFDELHARLMELNPLYEILVYCRTGVRSARAMQILRENGYSKIYNMAGGIEAWRQAGYPTVK